MNIGLLDIDNTGYPNLALMKISAYHKSIGDNVEWANPLFGDYDILYERISFWRNQGERYKVFAQPYRSITENNTIPQWQHDMARYANLRQVFAKCDFKEYRPRKGFICSEYF